MSEEGDGDELNRSQSKTESARDQIFNQFCEVTDFQEIQKSFRTLCDAIEASECEGLALYGSLKRELTSWKCRELWKLLDARASLPEYAGQKACERMKVLIVGGGPVGLRAAIEAALLGARVDLVEKRTSFSRNNSLHLWPFLITDLRGLGAKKFYGKFCAGAIDHISIKILQSILLKVCLLLGVKVYSGVKFTGLVEPKNANSGWTATVTPTSSPASSRNFDIILGADGKQNSLPGFRTKEFRAKLALAITVNFVNHNSTQEAAVPEIGGVSYHFNPKFFDTLSAEHQIDLENIVYYKDETHYFVMTAKKQSLLKKGVLKANFNSSEQLLSPSNVDRKSLERYAIEAATFSTKGELGDLEFEKNHKGENDVALFDFTSLFAAENASRIVEKKGKRILMCLAGDSLLEPFWPTGTGCARGFLSAFDAAWMMKRFASGADPIELLEEREAISYLLPQTTVDNLNKNYGAYTIDPKTRYLTLNEITPPGDVTHLFETDDQTAVRSRASTREKKAAQAAWQQDNKATTQSSGLKRSRSIENLPPRAPSAVPRSSDSPRTRRTREGQAVKASPSASPRASPQLPKGGKSSPSTKVNRAKVSASPKRASSSKPDQKEDKASDKKELTSSQQSTSEPKSKDVEPEQQRKVADLIQKLEPSSTGATAASPKSTTKGKVRQEGVKQKPASKGDKKKGEEKAKVKPEKVSKKQKEKEKEAKGRDSPAPKKRGFFSSLFKPKKKSYDVAGAEAAPGSPKHRKKSKKEDKRKSQPPKEEEPKPPTIQSIKEQLKQRGVAVTDCPDGEPEEKQDKEEGMSEVSLPSPDVVLPSPQKPLEQGPQEGEESVDGEAEPQMIVGSKREELPASPQIEEKQEEEEKEKGKEEKEKGEEEEEEEKEQEEMKGEEEEEKPRATVEETIRRLEPSVEASNELSYKFSKGKRSKETDLAEIYSRETKEETSHPLWLARVMQGLNKCLERLRKQNDNIIVSKTALEILNTIFSNVQLYPDADIYRRVRISSRRFHDKVWQYSDAQQFLARAGWVEIDDFIVLPIGKTVDIPKRILDKHLNIMNQMLWSMQLELPDSPDVLKRMRANKIRDRSISLGRRESYATRLVNESLERVEKDQLAMAAAKMRKPTPTGSLALGSPPGLQPLIEGKEDGEEEEEGGETTSDPFDAGVRQDKMEELQMIKAASAARNIWERRDRKSSVEVRQEREYKLILETELYDLGPRQVNPMSTPPAALSKLPEEEGKEQHATIPSPSFSSPLQRHTETEVTLEDEREAGVEPNSQQSLSQQEVLEAAIVASESARQVWKQLDDSATNDGNSTTPHKKEPGEERKASNDGNSTRVTTPHKKEPGEERKASNDGNSTRVTTPHKKEPGEERRASNDGNSTRVTTPHKKEPGEERRASNDGNSIRVTTPHKKESGEERRASNDGNSTRVTTPHKKEPGEERKASNDGNSTRVTTPHKKEPGEERKASNDGNSTRVTTPHKKEPGEERKASNDGNSTRVTTPHKKEPGEERKATSTSVGGKQPPHTDSHSSSPQPASPQPLPPADVQSATESSIKSGRWEYEKITMEAAAQARQKWMEGNLNPQDSPT